MKTEIRSNFNGKHSELVRELAEESQRAYLPHLRHVEAKVWNSTSQMFYGLNTIKGKVNAVVSRVLPLL